MPCRGQFVYENEGLVDRLDSVESRVAVEMKVDPDDPGSGLSINARGRRQRASM